MCPREKPIHLFGCLLLWRRMNVLFDVFSVFLFIYEIFLSYLQKKSKINKIKTRHEQFNLWPLISRIVLYVLWMTEDRGKDEKCEVYAIYTVIFSFPQCWSLVCLRSPCQGLLRWSKFFSPHPLFYFKMHVYF